MYSWDERKRFANLRKHGLDFRDAEAVFSGFTLTAEDRRGDHGEQRFLTVGLLGLATVVITHTERAGWTRIISMRKATRHETQNYYAQVPD